MCENLALQQFVFSTQVIGHCIELDLKRLLYSGMQFIYGIMKFKHGSYKLKELKLSKEEHFLCFASFTTLLPQKLPS